MSGGLTIKEQERVRYFLGYPNVSPAASLQYGIVRNADLFFLVDLAMTNIRPEALDGIRTLIQRMEDLECLLSGDVVDRLAAQRIGSLQLNSHEPELVENEIRRWGYQLADTLGCPVYRYAHRYRHIGRGAVGSIPRRR